MKKISVTLEKTKEGYVLSSEEFGKIYYFDDTDDNRKRVIKETANLVFDLMNTEIEGGTKYL